MILNELKKKLGQAKGLWIEEIPEILWRYHCTLQSTTKETAYRLTYGSDVMIPVELGKTSFRRQQFDENLNNEKLRANLDLIHKVR